MIDENLLKMCNAVVVQACDDWLSSEHKIRFYSDVEKAHEYIKRSKSNYTKEAVEEERIDRLNKAIWLKCDAEAFFKSQYFILFCNQGAERILDRLNHLANLNALNLQKGRNIERDLEKKKNKLGLV